SAMNNDMVTSAESMSSSLSQIADSVHQLQAALTQMQAGAGTLSSSLDSGSSAAGEVSTKSGALTSGLSSLQSGQQQLSQGISDLQSQSKELQSGLSEGSDGLNKIGKGLGTATTYLSDLSNTGTSVFYVPADVLKGKTFKSALTSYMSADHKTLQLQVIMDENPFSRSAMPVSKNIQKVATNALRGTKLAGSEVAIAGTAARNDDLKKISEADFIRTAAIMLAGILLVLIIITRSLIKPILIVLGLLLSYGAALHLGQLLIAQVMDTNELSWNVPFFSFIMLVALGVDYSIFLMMRYREAEGNASTRMVTAAGVIGAVVLSAALILAGTFAALIPSGVLSLIEVATVVIIGLAFLSLIVMPLFLPAGVALANKLLVKAVENES
ncbi:MAG: MMPL family transporter, partial [Weissella cibaria]